MIPSLNVEDSKVVYVPTGTRILIKTITDDDGNEIEVEEEKTKFARIGIRILMDDGGWWFYAFRTQSWSRHTPGEPKRYRTGCIVHDLRNQPIYHPEQIDRIGNVRLMEKAFRHCPTLLKNLQSAAIEALEKDENK
jgi:hypothetical protein